MNGNERDGGNDFGWQVENENLLLSSSEIMRVRTAHLIDFGFSGFKPGGLNSTKITKGNKFLA
jgi:hypothetical protein